MMLHQAQFKEKLQGHRRIKNTSIRIELSPAKEETEGWTMADWQKLADDFIREFDAVSLKRPDREDDDPHTHLANSQYVVSLHHDSKSQILHLHINANRIDMDGNVNNEYMIGKRATMAANKINEQRGWVQSMAKREWNIDEITNACIEALKEMDSFERELHIQVHTVGAQEKPHTIETESDLGETTSGQKHSCSDYGAEKNADNYPSCRICYSKNYAAEAIVITQADTVASHNVRASETAACHGSPRHRVERQELRC